jgi:hypothetical protein
VIVLLGALFGSDVLNLIIKWMAELLGKFHEPDKIKMFAFSRVMIRIGKAALISSLLVSLYSTLRVEVQQGLQNVRDPASFFDPLDLAVGWLGAIVVFVIFYKLRNYAD